MQTPIGILRKAVIVEIKKDEGLIVAQIDTSSITLPLSNQKNKKVQIPFAFYSVDGLFIGGLAKIGTPIIIGQGEGTNWYFVSFYVSNVPQMPNISEGELLTQANENTRISLNNKSIIDIGSKINNLHANTSVKKENNKLQSTFSNNLFFSEAAREITGVIKREVRGDNNITSNLKLSSENYDNNLTTIALDPTRSAVINSQDSTKNPPFVEKRELIYEFAYSSKINDDISEAAIYQQSGQINNNTTTTLLPNRHDSKTDLLSLSLNSPNFLIETIKGTVVDIFGNILDLNRTPIIGYGINKSLSLDSNSNKEQSFNKLKAAQRKSLAYHFEINTKKDLLSLNNKLPDISSKDDYARNRSRFFIDIDKEGQFKLNVPSSSETGNIPLHVRYENYSTFGTEDNNNPNKLIYREDNLDIFLDSFAKDDIEIKDDNNIVISPTDRIDNRHIKHGMPFHNVLKSGIAFQTKYANKFLDYQYIFKPVDITKLPTIETPVSKVIYASGENANAGGRSGALHFDGSLEMSIGANTIDRQSLWLDTAGGIVANIGRDKNFSSGIISLDGDLSVQIGGNGVSGDNRFNNLNNNYRGGSLDIRVMNEGFTVSIVRIDKNGITIMTPSSITLSGRKIVMAAKEIDIRADRLALNDRLVNKFPANSI